MIIFSKQQMGSWIWKSIIKCKSSFLNGACYSIGRNSKVRLREDPWIPDTPHFKFSTNFNCPANLCYVRDLMNSDRCSWNLDLIHRVVPPQTAMLIRKINILDNPEQEALIWVPSKTGNFSIKSSYIVNQREQFMSNSHISRETW